MLGMLKNVKYFSKPFANLTALLKFASVIMGHDSKALVIT